MKISLEKIKNHHEAIIADEKEKIAALNEKIKIRGQYDSNDVIKNLKNMIEIERRRATILQCEETIKSSYFFSE